MTLNFSSRPMLAMQSPQEDVFATSIWEEEGDALWRGPSCMWGRGGESNHWHESGGASVMSGDMGSSHDSGSDDIVNLLPVDPFGMELASTWTAAIAGWIEDLKMDYRDGVVEADEDSSLSPSWREALSTIKLQGKFGEPLYWWEEELPGLTGTSARFGDSYYETPSFDLDVDSWVIDRQDGDWECYSEISMQESGQLLLESMGVVDTLGDAYESENDHAGEDLDGGGCDLPPEGFPFALRYLDLADLLSVASVCKTLRYAVVNDPLLWKCIHVGSPLNERLTDDALLQLSQRAQGSLQCLNLVECSKITDDGLKRVLERNRRITKLSVFRCARLTMKGVLSNLKLFKTPETPRMENLMIGDIYGAEQSHYEDLKQLLDLDNYQNVVRKPRFHGSTFASQSCDYDCPLDIELCPKCNNLRLVYDCPSEACQGKSSEPCRACKFCIARCYYCGRCINDDEYEETFSLDIRCSDCMKQLMQDAHRS